MKRLLQRQVVILLFICNSLSLAAQIYYLPERDSSTVSAFEYATKQIKKTNAFKLDLEMHATFNTEFIEKKFDNAAFRFNQIKIETTGKIGNRLFYWYRQQLNNENQTMSLENLPRSIDYGLIGIRLSDKFTLIAGKQALDLGGFEYDLNELDVYEYSDMNEYTDCYYTGLSLIYHPTESQEFRIQATDNRIGSMEDQYGLLPDHIENSKAPLYYSVNWNSSYWDELLNLRYSFNAGEQAKKNWMYMTYIGNNISTGGIDAYFDIMYSRGDIDQLGILSELLAGDENSTRLLNTDYFSLVAEVNYQWNPKWNVFAKGMYETASVFKSYDDMVKGKYRTAYGYQGGIEYYPMEDDNLHFFFTYVGRTYLLTEKAKALGASIENTQRLSIGFIYKLPLF